MCGIAGILGADQPPEAAVRAMIERLQHRGPDGIRVESGPGWCVGHLSGSRTGRRVNGW